MSVTWKHRSCAAYFDHQNGHPVLCSVEQHVSDSGFMCFGMGMTLLLSHFIPQIFLKVASFNLSRIRTFSAIFLFSWTKLCTWTTQLFFWLIDKSVQIHRITHTFLLILYCNSRYIQMTWLYLESPIYIGPRKRLNIYLTHIYT